MNLRMLPAIVVAVALSSTAVICHAAGNATQAEATAMVKKGLAYLKANGKDKAYAEITPELVAQREEYAAYLAGFESEASR